LQLQKFSHELRTLTVTTEKYFQSLTANVALFAASLHKLVRLKVESFLISKTLFSSLLRLKQLRHLDMSVEGVALLQSLDHTCPSLVTFNIGFRDGFQSQMLENLVRWCPGIQELYIFFGEDLKDADLLILAQGLTHLRILQTENTTAVSPAGLLRFAELRGHGLHELNFYFPSGFTMTDFQDLLGFCPNLENGDFSFVDQKNDWTMSNAVDFVLPTTKIKWVSTSFMALMPFTRSIAAHVRLLSLSYCRDLTFFQIKEVVKECGCLEDLRLHLCCCRLGLNVEASGRVAAGEGSKTVQELWLHFCEKVDVQAKSVARKVMDLCPRVKRLQLRRGRKFDPLAQVNNRLPFLEELKVYRCSLVTPTASNQMGAFPPVKSIIFEECMNVSDELLALLAELCSSLSHLTVSCDYLEGLNGGEDVPTFEGLLRLLTLLPTLTQLSLSGCVFSGRMVRMEWKGLAAKLPVLKLQQVTFVGVPPRLTAEQILELVRRCPELRQLGVKSSWGGSHLAEQLTDSWLGEVVRACPQLSRLDLGKGIDDWQPAVSEAAIQRAVRQRPALRILCKKSSADVCGF